MSRADKSVQAALRTSGAPGPCAEVAGRLLARFPHLSDEEARTSVLRTYADARQASCGAGEEIAPSQTEAKRWRVSSVYDSEVPARPPDLSEGRAACWALGGGFGVSL